MSRLFEEVCLLRRFHAIHFLILLLVSGCAETKLHTVDDSRLQQQLAPLEDGKTKREEITRRLGEPTSPFQNSTILGYRLILVEEGRNLSEKEYRSILVNLESGYQAGHYGWVNDRRKLLSEKGALFTVRDQNKEDKLLDILTREAEYSLVLVVDDQDTLAQHGLRRIMP